MDEIRQETIEEVAKVLMTKKFDIKMRYLYDYFAIAKDLIEKHPDRTPDEIGEIYEKECQEQERGNGENEK